MWLVLSESIDNGDWVRETAEPYNTGRVQVRGKDTLCILGIAIFLGILPGCIIEPLHFDFFFF